MVNFVDDSYGSPLCLLKYNPARRVGMFFVGVMGLPMVLEQTLGTDCSGFSQSRIPALCVGLKSMAGFKNKAILMASGSAA